jgi:hypothetical protein
MGAMLAALMGDLRLDQDGVQSILKVMVSPLLFVYFVGRVALFVLAFMSLRAVPPGAYEAIHWMTFIPHI